MTPEAAQAVLTDPQILTLTLWGEARGEGVLGQIAVGCLIRNRLDDGRWGGSYAKVCLAPWQFSCWRPEGGRSNYDALMAHADAMASGKGLPEDAALRQCAWVAQGVIGAWIADITKDANHYFSPAAMKPKGAVPHWAKGHVPVAVLSNHVFYRLP